MRLKARLIVVEYGSWFQSPTSLPSLMAKSTLKENINNLRFGAHAQEESRDSVHEKPQGKKKRKEHIVFLKKLGHFAAFMSHSYGVLDNLVD